VRSAFRSTADETHGRAVGGKAQYDRGADAPAAAENENSAAFARIPATDALMPDPAPTMSAAR